MKTFLKLYFHFHTPKIERDISSKRFLHKYTILPNLKTLNYQEWIVNLNIKVSFWLRFCIFMTKEKCAIIYFRQNCVSLYFFALDSCLLLQARRNIYKPSGGKLVINILQCTVFWQASILSGSGFNECLVGLLRFQFFLWKRNGLGINPEISQFFKKLSIIYEQSKSAKKHYFEHVWAKFVQPSMLTWYQWTCSKRN